MHPHSLTPDEKLAVVAALASHPDAEVFSVLYELLDLDTLLHVMLVLGGKTLTVPTVSMIPQSLEVAKAAVEAFRTSRTSLSAARKNGIPDRADQVAVALRALKQNEKNRSALSNREKAVLEKLSL
jgi:hypothetical protein